MATALPGIRARRTTRRHILLAVLIFALLVPVAGAAKPDTYLGKYQVGDTVAFSWQVDVETSPVWAVYQITLDGYKGLLRCSGCFTETTPGVWASDMYLSDRFFVDSAEYMICADDGVWESGVLKQWTFKIGGKGNKPVKADASLTACP